MGLEIVKTYILIISTLFITGLVTSVVGESARREVIHSGDDKLAGEALRNTLDQVNTEPNLDFEVLLVCPKIPGCVFDISGQAIKIERHFKIRGELTEGVRPVIVNQGTPIDIELNSPPTLSTALHIEKINIFANEKHPGDSRLRISGSSGLVLLDQMVFSGHNSGITGRGGAIITTIGSNVDVDIRTVSFQENGAERGGAIYHTGHGDFIVRNSFFRSNIATEQGGAIWTDAKIELAGVTFEANKCTGSSMNVGNGGAIYAAGSDSDLIILNSRSLGGNYAKFGTLIYGDMERHIDIDGLDSKDDSESIYLANDASLEISRARIRRGVICSDDPTTEVVERYGCGSDILVGSFCTKGSQDQPESEDDEDEDGVSCVFDCNDEDPNIRPFVQEVANGTDSNCNGLADEAIDTDGDGVTDDVDACPEDYRKIAPDACGCGIIDEIDYEGCVTCVTPRVATREKVDYSEWHAIQEDPWSYIQEEQVSPFAGYPENEAFQAHDGYWYWLSAGVWYYYDGSNWVQGGNY